MTAGEAAISGVWVGKRVVFVACHETPHGSLRDVDQHVSRSDGLVNVLPCEVCRSR